MVDAIYINSYSQTLQSMNLTSTFQLAQLSVRLEEKQQFNPSDLVVLESGVEALTGTVVATNQTIALANRLWLLLHELPPQTYWRTMTYIIDSAKYPQTQTLGLCSLTKRLPFEWRHLSGEFRAHLAQLLMGLEGKREAGDAMVALLKMEWQGQLGGYLAKITGDIDKINSANLVVRLELIGRILREGFQNWSIDFTTAQKGLFRKCVDAQVRVLLKFVYVCLSQREEVEVKLAGLRLVRQIVQLVPIFQMFNCELLSAVVELLHRKDCRREAMSCLRQLFGFRETEESTPHHSKIARRLFTVLEQEIGRWRPKDRNNRRPVTMFDKQSASTNDSFCQKETQIGDRRHNEKFSNQLLELLYLYLLRYVPSMASRPNEKILEIESDSSTKVFFSKELYDYFASGFWGFAEFLAFLQGGEQMGVIGEEEIERNYQMLVSVKLTLLLYCKLGLSFEEIICKVMEKLVSLSPLEQAFRKFYVIFQMLYDGEKVLLEMNEVRSYSEQYCQTYRQAMSMIVGNKNLTQLYAESIERLLDNGIISLDGTQQNRNVQQISKIIGVVNRVTWSLVGYFSAGGETVGLMSVSRIVGCMIQQAGSVPQIQLRRCFSLNSKCLLQAYKGTQFNQILFSSLGNNSGDLVHELNIVVLSRIFLHQGFQFKELGSRWKENIMRMVQKVQQIRHIGTYGSQFCKIYPAMFRVGMKGINAVTGGEMQRVMAGHVKEWLKQLAYDQLQASAAALPEETLVDVVALKRVNSVLGSLEDVTVLLLEMAKGREKGRYWILKHHLASLKQPLVTLGFKYKIYSDLVCDYTFENFQIGEIIEFREKFNMFVSNMAMLFLAISRLEASEEKVSPEKRAVLLRERVALIGVSVSQLSQDFQSQLEFKCSSYLQMLVQYYRLLAYQGKIGSQQVVNMSIGSTCAVLEETNVTGLERLNVAKFRFWRSLVEQFTDQLQIQNFDYLSKLYLGLEDLTVAGMEGCLQVVQRLLQKLQAHQFKEGAIPSIWCNFASLFVTTFEHFFSPMVSCEQVFKRLGHIFYLSFLVGEQSGWKLYPGTKSNIEILFVKLREHIKQRIGLQGGQLQQILVLIFKERNEQKFMSLLRDYRVKLIREHQSKSQTINY